MYCERSDRVALEIRYMFCSVEHNVRILVFFHHTSTMSISLGLFREKNSGINYLYVDFPILHMLGYNVWQGKVGWRERNSYLQFEQPWLSFPVNTITFYYRQITLIH